MFASSGDVFIYLSTPFSLCLCFLDISKPPPHAPCTGHNMVITLNILILIIMPQQTADLYSFVFIFSLEINILLHPHEATYCTFHRCRQFHWWDQRLRRRWYQRWQSQTVEHTPTMQRHSTHNNKKRQFLVEFRLLCSFLSAWLLTSKRSAKTRCSNDALSICTYCWGKIVSPFLLVYASLCLWRKEILKSRGSVVCEQTEALTLLK